jgi:hypothetical protein
MLPAKYILVGAYRWLDLLKSSTRVQAQHLFMTSPRYADMTGSNYDEAYDWVVNKGLLEQQESGLPPSIQVLEAALADKKSALEDIGLETISSPGLLPSPILDAARLLKIDDAEAWRVTVAAKYKVDLERRTRIGALGEEALVGLLTQAGMKVYHGSLDSDALGWDVMASHIDVTKHIEVKSTTSLARLRIYLSRHEYNVSIGDAQWILAIVLITEEGRLQRLAHLRPDVLSRLVPVDGPSRGHWQLCSIDLQQAELVPGLPFDCPGLPHDGVGIDSDQPIWWPDC